MYEFDVQDMTCGGCAASVTRAVQRIDAGAKVDVDLAAKKVKVTSGRTLDEVRAAIADAGFPVTGAR
ncbi:copper chaperone [Duganella ginsengisoli]|uniref:Copper chaperone n=2 Tax=Pseudoduganella ginsengisoli TaxID=1462440 RepID=A0A6L6PZL8_9BURK|nr:heavy-metal-associated domain-containing protein [Pseudoduganella ginsengisoli]MTW02790.1 copper chaperone [Pseudoduganella ginsengisoli]